MSARKPVEERGGHHALPAVIPASSGTLVAPEPPPRVPVHLHGRWAQFWTSPVAQVLDPVSDLEPAARLFELYGLDQDMGKAVNNYMEWMQNRPEDDEGFQFDPQFARVRLAVAAEVRQLEQMLGVTPRGRLAIGAAVAAAGRAAPKEVPHDDSED